MTILIGPPEPGEAARSGNAVGRRWRNASSRSFARNGVDRKAALKLAARERGLTKREAYKQLLVKRPN